MRVGLTGGIGSGKSAVAAFLHECGAWIVDTDLLAREAVAPGSSALRGIADAWPQTVHGGVLDRAALSAIVFSQADQRARLNAILHPEVRRLAFEREAKAPANAMVVHVVPLLFETGYAGALDKSVLVIAPVGQRMARIVARDGLSENDVRARMSAQIEPEEARPLADYVVNNDAGLPELRSRTRAVYDLLAAGAV